VCTPRLLSIQSYQDLFDKAIDRCKLRYREDQTDEEIRLLKVEIEKLKGVDAKLNELIEANAKTAVEAQDKIVKSQDLKNQKVKDNFVNVMKQIKEGKEVSKALKIQDEAIKTEHEKLEGIVTAFKE